MATSGIKVVALWFAMQMVPSGCMAQHRSAESARRRRSRIWIPLAISVSVLIVVAALTAEQESIRALRHTRWGLLGLAPLVLAVRVFAGALRIHFLACGRLTLAGAVRAQLAWDFFSNISPSSIGGGPIVPAYIARDGGVPLGEATAFTVLAMLMDQLWFACGIVIVFVASLSVNVVPDSLGAVGVWTFGLYIAGFLLWIGVFAYSTFVRPHLLTQLVTRVFALPFLRRRRGQAKRVMRSLELHAQILRSQRPLFYVEGFVWTLLTWIARYALVVVIVVSVSGNADAVLVFLRSVAMLLCALVIPTPGGSGGIEGLYALLIGPLMPSALVAPTLLIWRVLAYYVFIAAGAFLTMHHFMRSEGGD